jgi:hypothetical protein
MTVAAIGVLAMCVVTFDHEALGHGSACLLLHGHIRLLTSSLFRCDVRSGWIDPAGPGMNLLIGTIALVAQRLIPSERTKLRLFLIALTAFSFFWEGGYLIRAMHRRDGDVYYFAQFMLGDVTLAERWAFAIAGLALFVFCARRTSRALLDLCPRASAARSLARILWISATAGAAAAALAYRESGWGNLRDAVLEIGLASFPLLILPIRGQTTGGVPPVIRRNPITIGLAVLVYCAFVATLGRGLGV